MWISICFAIVVYQLRGKIVVLRISRHFYIKTISTVNVVIIAIVIIDTKSLIVPQSASRINGILRQFCVKIKFVLSKV